MGRENGEDYASDFLIMLNTWDGAVRFIDNSKAKTRFESKDSKPLDIARLLGWRRHTGCR
jgi:hypothetical protein